MPQHQNYEQAPRHRLAGGEKGTTSFWNVPLRRKSGGTWFLLRFILSSSMTRDSVLYRLLPGMHAETNNDCTWRTINSVKDAPWSAQNLLVFQSKELTLTECCRLAHTKVQDNMLRDALNLRAAVAKVQWGKTTVWGLPAE
eukprot:g38509.t1